MSIECIFQFEALDSTRALNQRSEYLISKGIYHGGNVEAVAGQLQVVVHPFCLVSTDGMHVVSDTDEYIPIASGDFYVVCRAKYVMDDTPDVSLTTIACSTYESWSSEDKALYVKFAKVSSAGFNVVVDTECKESISPVGRNPYRGYYLSAEELYAGATGAQDGDFAMVKSDDTSGATMYVYANKQWHNHGSSASNEQRLMEHRSNIDYEQAHSIPSENDVSDGQKRYNGAYHLNWNEAYALGTKLEKISGSVQVEPTFTKSITFTGKGRVTAVRLLHRGTTITGLKKGDTTIAMTATDNPSAEGQYRLDVNDCVIYLYGASGITYTLSYSYSNYKKVVVLDNELGGTMHSSDYAAIAGNLYANDGSDKPSDTNRFITENTPTIKRVAVECASASNNRIKVTLGSGEKFYLGDTAYPSVKLFKLVNSDGSVARNSSSKPILVTGVYKAESGSDAPDVSDNFSTSNVIYLGTNGIDSELAGTGYVTGMYVLCYTQSTIMGARVAGTLDQYEYKFGLVDTLTARTSFLSVNDGVSGNSNVKISTTYVKLFGKSAAATLTAEYGTDNVAHIYSKATGSSVSAGVKLANDGTATLHGSTSKIVSDSGAYVSVGSNTTIAGSKINIGTDNSSGDVGIGRYSNSGESTITTTIWSDIIQLYGKTSSYVYGKNIYIGYGSGAQATTNINIGNLNVTTATLEAATTYVKGNTALYVNTTKGSTNIGNGSGNTDIKGLNISLTSSGSTSITGTNGAFSLSVKSLTASSTGQVSISSSSSSTTINGYGVLVNWNTTGSTYVGNLSNVLNLRGSSMNIESDYVIFGPPYVSGTGNSTKVRQMEIRAWSRENKPTSTNYNFVAIWAGHGATANDAKQGYLQIHNYAEDSVNISLSSTCSKSSISLYSKTTDNSRYPIKIEGQATSSSGGTPVYIKGVTNASANSSNVLGVFIECVDDKALQNNQYNRRGYATISRNKIRLQVEGYGYESKSKPSLLLDGGGGVTSIPVSLYTGGYGSLSFSTNNHYLTVRDGTYARSDISKGVGSVTSLADQSSNVTDSFLLEACMHQSRPRKMSTGGYRTHTFQGFLGMSSHHLLVSLNNGRGAQTYMRLTSNYGYYVHDYPGINFHTGTSTKVDGSDSVFGADMFLGSNGVVNLNSSSSVNLYYYTGSKQKGGKVSITATGAYVYGDQTNLSGARLVVNSSGADLYGSNPNYYVSVGSSKAILGGPYVQVGNSITSTVYIYGYVSAPYAGGYGQYVTGAGTTFTPYSSSDSIFGGKSNCKINEVRIGLNGGSILGWNTSTYSTKAANFPFVSLGTNKLYISNNQYISVSYKDSKGNSKTRMFKPVYWDTGEIS